MEEFTERCIGCFNDDNVPQIYRVQSEVLKAVFQTSNLSLCYICKRIAQSSDRFIRNVQDNQLLLQNLHSITDADIKAVKLEPQPLINLRNATTHTMDLGNEETKVEPFPIQVYNRSKIQLKVEKEENALDDFVDNDNLDYDEPLIKEEKQCPLEVSLEESNKILDSINSESVKKSKKVKKKTEIKNKECTSTCDLEDTSKVVTVYITREQFLKEREELAKKRLYLDSIYKCENCVKGFSFKDIYEKHMKKHSEANGDFECDLCKQRVKSAEKLMSHQKYHEIRYKCTACGILRVCRETIKCHFNAAHAVDNDVEMYPCPHCKRIFRRKVSLRKHIYYTHKYRRVTCDYCYKNYVNNDSLRMHILKKHSKQGLNGIVPTKGHICPQCGKGFYSAGLLRVHMDTHSNARNYYCVECNKSFKTEMSLKQHLTKTAPHVQYVELPLQCEHCDKRFGVKRDLERHMNRIHLNIRPFQCDKCDKAYVNQWSLTDHNRYTHEGFTRPRLFPCSMCDKVFMRNCTRKAHMRTHTGERPYKCTKCTAQFSQSGVLNTHMKLVHLKLTRDGRPKSTANTFR